ncbi:DinB family protein [Christiangramia aquimixticola]|uniref:DinB family protein n=1 Tax=Christiangramia aquimixticola TaxID=1697558 RepID=UPI003AA7D604
MKKYFKELLEYSHFYNQELIKKFNDGDLHYVLSESSRRLMSHILNEQSAWSNRIMQKDLVDVWKVWDANELEKIEAQNYKETLEILEKEDLERIVQYKTPKGEQFSNSIKDIMFHIVNHSTYHRGQIAKEFRQKGVDPVISDFIYYKQNA